MQEQGKIEQHTNSDFTQKAALLHMFRQNQAARVQGEICVQPRHTASGRRRLCWRQNQPSQKFLARSQWQWHTSHTNHNTQTLWPTHRRLWHSVCRGDMFHVHKEPEWWSVIYNHWKINNRHVYHGGLKVPGQYQRSARNDRAMHTKQLVCGNMLLHWKKFMCCLATVRWPELNK